MTTNRPDVAENVCKMKIIEKLSLLIAATAFIGSASAQYKFGGLMMDRDGMMSNDMFTLSQTGFGFGSARSMSMSGAFASLGGDVAAMGINPAGLGMYRHDEVSVTPMIGFQSSVNSAPSWGDNKQSRAAMSNIGVVLNVYESSRTSLVSLSIGAGYNRVADFNYRYGFTSESGPSSAPYRSINDAFSRQLGQGGIFPDNNGSLNYGYNTAYYWGGALAYNGYLLDVGEDDLGRYWTSADRIGANAGVGHTASVDSRGSIGEYDLALGLNFDNMFYLGATIGLQNVNWKRQLYYGEDYIYNGSAPVYSDGEPLQTPAEWMDYNQAVNVSGQGVNFKLGFILRPISALRIGAAIHTPTYYQLNRTYQAYLASNFNAAGDTTPSLDDDGDNTWNFVSPTRVMFGASYTIGRFAILSVDYERDWYNGMRVKNIPAGFDLTEADYRAEFTGNFKGSNTLRAGVEVKPLPMFALRAGYGVTDSMLRNDRALYYNTPLTYRSTCYSAGAGLVFGGFTVDLAYQYIENKQTEYMLYYALDSRAGVFDTASPYYSTDFKRKYVILTLGYKF